jgi:hypothetical protein
VQERLGGARAYIAERQREITELREGGHLHVSPTVKNQAFAAVRHHSNTCIASFLKIKLSARLWDCDWIRHI